MAYYINRKEKNAALQLSILLKDCIKNCRHDWNELVFLCIGTDRITGDSLGPYIGYVLSQYTLTKATIYGTLEEPVHALNLHKKLQQIQVRHPNALVVAIDASLGSKKHLGYITIGNGAIHPGAGVHKDLPAVGDIYITGIVSATGFLEHMALQNTRLSFVISIADIITRAILTSCRNLPGSCRQVPASAHIGVWRRSRDACFHLPPGRVRREVKSPPLAAFTEEP